MPRKDLEEGISRYDFVSLNRACTKARSSQEDFPSLSLSVINVPDSSEELQQDCAT